ncbi:MAG TPA: glutamine synthetase III [Candidatus Coprenecus avistercoris]|uniref:Glutamine synthetase III n=1 Tax=Candidatus Coprenecus avistercoris TaxID=2840730 RepID=A0A9D1E028_9BACT|nr:glutamine synthetase III [Candidatus Coprenecus avistercoris]
MSNFRIRALQEFSTHRAERFFEEDRPVSEYFGQNVFTMERMRKYLSPDAYAHVQSSIREGTSIDRRFADQIAAGMKTWAVEMGATHYTHWFHPMTDSTAEKHEAFIDRDSEGHVFETFKGNTLVQQESDGSSFPNGGLRNTFEARGYTAWDPSSPAFILDSTLCIPTVFVAYTGESLDMKLPLLKSLRALDRAAVDVVHLFDRNVRKVNVMLGPEQEYFLVDDAFYRARPDLQICNRTLLGHTAAKDQQLEDHYFGTIPSRTMAFMKDFEVNAYKLGILLKTRHNEVAPNQFECAPLYCEANLAIDQNLILMLLMRKVAKKHHFKVLFHEKPFDGVNGSGKHCNWSLVTDTGVNLLSPGRTPRTNLQFLSIFVSVIRAVQEHSHLLMSSVASLSNSYRLGGHEAPPAIMSVFVGTTLDKVLRSIEDMSDYGGEDGERARLKVINDIPEILPDNTDRNRTSPFAFTGNRFEFRAVGSSVNVSAPMYVLNAAVARQLVRFRSLVDERIAAGEKHDDAIFNVIRQYVLESKDIRFEGNGYSKEWQEEALRRGLRPVGEVPEANKALIEPATVELFSSQGILSDRELYARYEVQQETYTKKLQIEARVLGDLIVNHVVPTAIKFQNTLIENCQGLKDLFGAERMRQMCTSQLRMIEKISRYVDSLRKDVHDMIDERRRANQIADVTERAEAYCSLVLPYMQKIREVSDKLEMLVDDELWPLPKYREMLLSR